MPIDVDNSSSVNDSTSFDEASVSSTSNQVAPPEATNKKKRNLPSIPGGMDRRLCFVLLALAISWCCNAKDLAAADLKRESLEKQVQVSGNGDLCSQCKELVATYSDEQKQKQLTAQLHGYCYLVSPSPQQCINQVDQSLSSIFEVISSSTPESFCNPFFFCKEGASISQYASNSSCDLCHRAVTEAIQQLKNPDTQVEVLQLLLKACDSAKNISTKCKKLVFEYAPLIMVNAEQFPGTNDICTLLHVCDSPIHRMEESRHSAS
nr:prosaposin-like [Ipomoea batatas]